MRRLDERERRCRFTLPASLREWYGLAGAKRVLDANNFGDGQYAVSLGELGGRRVNDAGDDDPAGRYVFLVSGGEGGFPIFLRLDGSDDPPVYQLVHKPEFTWYTFAGFVFDWLAWPHIDPDQSGPFLTAVDALPTASELARLRRTLVAGPQGHHDKARKSRAGKVRTFPSYGIDAGLHNYRFCGRDGGGIVAAHCGREGRGGAVRTRWYVAARSEDALLNLTEKVWRVGTLARTLEPLAGRDGAAARRVLERLRRA